MIEDAFRYPMERDDWVKTVLIGGVLVFFGFLLIPVFPVYGYVIRAIRGSVDGEETPPAFEDWEALFVDGVKAWAINVLYFLVPGIVAFVTIGGSIAALATDSPMGTGAGVAGLFSGLVVTVILSVVFGYLVVAGIVNFAVEGRFGAAFDVDALRAIAFTSDYAVAWVLSIVAFIVAGIVAGIPFIGVVLGPFASFYAAVVAARLWADGCRDSLTGAAAT